MLRWELATSVSGTMKGALSQYTDGSMRTSTLSRCRGPEPAATDAILCAVDRRHRRPGVYQQIAVYRLGNNKASDYRRDSAGPDLSVCLWNCASRPTARRKSRKSRVATDTHSADTFGGRGGSPLTAELAAQIDSGPAGKDRHSQGTATVRRASYRRAG